VPIVRRKMRKNGLDDGQKRQTVNKEQKTNNKMRGWTLGGEHKQKLNSWIKTSDL